MIPQQLTDSFVPICAGLFVSLVNKYILSNPKLDACCTAVEPEEVESESDDTTKTEMSDALSKSSGTTAATQPIPHPIHTGHHAYYYTHHA